MIRLLMDGTINQNVVCMHCGTPADIGLIFCTKCGATLRPAVPLTKLTPMAKEHNGQMRRPTPLAFFLICGVVDFVFGCIKWHSVLSGVGAVVGGLPLTALLFLLFRASWKGNHGSKVPPN